MRRLLRRTTAIAILLVLGGAAPVAADPAGPSDYRSAVTSVDPAVEGVDVEVVGGDAFLQLRVESGHEVVVEGYEGEPYLRVGADGTVEENVNSPATVLNQDRYVEVDASDFDADAEPEWRAVDDDAEYAWHDHRIHWMSPDRGDVEAGDEMPTSPWQVPLVVDGERVVVTGTLTYVGSTSPVPWAALGVGLAGVALVAGWATARAVVVAVAAVLAGAVGATVAGWAEWSSQPDGAGASVAVAAVPIVGLVAAVGAAGAAAFRRSTLAAVGVLAASAALLGWALLRLDVLTHPVLPTDLDAGVDRAATVAAAGFGLAAAVLALRSGAFALPDTADGSLVTGPE